MGLRPAAVTETSDFAPVSSKEFLDIQATIKCGFILKRVRDMIRTYSQMIGFYMEFKTELKWVNRPNTYFSMHNTREKLLQKLIFPSNWHWQSKN